MIECNECGKIGDHSEGGPFCELNKEISKLEARVKELEAGIDLEMKMRNQFKQERNEARAENARFVAENSSMHKALERISKMGQQTKDGHRIHGPWTIAKEALRELDVSHSKQTEQKVQNETQSELDGEKAPCCGGLIVPCPLHT